MTTRRTETRRTKSISREGAGAARSTRELLSRQVRGRAAGQTGGVVHHVESWLQEPKDYSVSCRLVATDATMRQLAAFLRCPSCRLVPPPATSRKLKQILRRQVRALL